MMLEAGPLSAVTVRLTRAWASTPAGAAAASRFGATAVPGSCTQAAAAPSIEGESSLVNSCTCGIVNC